MKAIACHTRSSPRILKPEVWKPLGKEQTQRQCQDAIADRERTVTDSKERTCVKYPVVRPCDADRRNHSPRFTSDKVAAFNGRPAPVNQPKRSE